MHYQQQTPGKLPTDWTEADDNAMAEDAKSERPIDLTGKIRHDRGLCTSVIKSDEENAERIRVILQAYLDGEPMERANRSADDWERVCDLPQDFNFRYRVPNYEE